MDTSVYFCVLVITRNARLFNDEVEYFPKHDWTEPPII